MAPSQSSTRPTFYDVRDVAQMFRMSRMTVYRAIQSGELPAVRMRGRWLVPATVIDALITEAEAALARRAADPADAWLGQEVGP
jgi:excisionase family DNA binding protein